MREKAQEIRRLLEGLTETLKPMVTFERTEVSQDQLVILSQCQNSDIRLLNKKQEVLKLDRAGKLAATVSSFDTIHQLLFLSNSYELLIDTEAPEDDGGDYTTWKALPQPLLAWIQDQKGLRILGEPISSREMLELASQLLHRKTTHRFSDTLTSPIVNIAVQMALQYIKEVTRRGSKLTLISTIPGRLNQIVQRQCLRATSLYWTTLSTVSQRNAGDLYLLWSMKDLTVVD
jgi:hypothetical protein